MDEYNFSDIAFTTSLKEQGYRVYTIYDGIIFPIFVWENVQWMLHQTYRSNASTRRLYWKNRRRLRDGRVTISPLCGPVYCVRPRVFFFVKSVEIRDLCLRSSLFGVLALSNTIVLLKILLRDIVWKIKIKWYLVWESNPYVYWPWILNPMRIPISPTRFKSIIIDRKERYKVSEVSGFKPCIYTPVVNHSLFALYLSSY